MIRPVSIRVAVSAFALVATTTPGAMAEVLVRNDFAHVSETSLLGPDVIPAAANWANASGHEAGAGAAFARARGIAATYDGDNDPSTPEVDIPGGYEINGYADVYPAQTLKITTTLPRPLAKDGVVSLSFWAAFRLSGTAADTSGAGVHVRNVTKGVDLIPLTAPSFAKDVTHWRFNQLTFVQDPAYAGDTIEVVFHAGGVDDSSGLALADVTLRTDATGPAAVSTPKSAAVVVLKPTARPPAPDAGVPVRADVPLEKDRPRHEQLLREKQDVLKNGPVQVVFIGDSITEGWRAKPQADLFAERWGAFNPYNIGIRADETQHVLWRIEHGALDGLSPQVVVLMLGTNNIGNANHMTAEATVQGVEAVVKAVRRSLPSSRVLLLGILPRGESSDDPHRETIRSVNAALAKLDDGGAPVAFLDFGDHYLDGQGRLRKELMPDGLHPSAAGYKIWADAIDERLKALVR